MSAKLRTLPLVSIKRQLTKYVAVSFFAVCVLTAVLWRSGEYINTKELLDTEGDRLTLNAHAQADQILPAVLLTEEYGSLTLQTERLRTEENLTAAYFVPASEAATQSFLQCPQTRDGTHLCKDYFRRELLSASSVGFEGSIQGYLVKKTGLRSSRPIWHGILPLVLLLGGTAAVFLGLIASILLFVERRIRKPLLTLSEQLTPILDGEERVELKNFNVLEMRFIGSQVKELVRKYEAKKAAAATGELAAQVAHDIRSPLALLSVLAQDRGEFTAHKRHLLEVASNRINTIATELLERHREKVAPHGERASLVLTAVEEIISEKKALHSHEKTRLQLHVARGVHRAFIRIDALELKRAIANLIENSFESGAKAIDVSVLWANDSRKVAVEVLDNGPGIPEEILPHVGTKGVSSKEKGNGLGLHHARGVAECNGGAFSIESSRTKGTAIRLTFPLAEEPRWFGDRLCLKSQQPVVIVDDDPSVHALWRIKLGDQPQQSFLSTQGIEHSVLREPEAFFLVDYHIGTSLNGLDFIAEHGLQNRCLVVTNAFEDEQLQARCVKLGCKILPKPILSYLEPIVLAESPVDSALQDDAKAADVPDLVLIDDCEVVRMSWELVSKNQGLRLLTLSRWEQLSGVYLTAKTPIFIDYWLGEGTSGLSVADSLHEKGFRELYLTTGDFGMASPRPYLRQVCDKNFPGALVRDLLGDDRRTG